MNNVSFLVETQCLFTKLKDEEVKAAGTNKEGHKLWIPTPKIKQSLNNHKKRSEI